MYSSWNLYKDTNYGMCHAEHSHILLVCRNREKLIFFLYPLYLSIILQPGLLFWGFTSLWWYMYFSKFVTWKQEITNLWNRSGEIGNRIPGLLLRKQELDHYTIISVNHACQVSRFAQNELWLQKTASAIITNNNYCRLKINKVLINLFIVINRPIWWKYEANWEFTKSRPSRGVKGGVLPIRSPAVWHVCVNRYSRSLIWPSQISLY